VERDDAFLLPTAKKMRFQFLYGGAALAPLAPRNKKSSPHNTRSDFPNLLFFRQAKQVFRCARKAGAALANVVSVRRKRACGAHTVVLKKKFF